MRSGAEPRCAAQPRIDPDGFSRPASAARALRGRDSDELGEHAERPESPESAYRRPCWSNSPWRTHLQVR